MRIRIINFCDVFLIMKRGVMSKESIIRIFDLVVVFFIFTVLFYNVRAEIKNKGLDQSYAALDLALESSLVSSAPGNLAVHYFSDNDFDYIIDDEVIVLYGTSEKAYRILRDKKVALDRTSEGLILRKDE